jgi:hypothetical protein
MAVQISVSPATQPKKEPSFPLLLKAADSDLVVLFISKAAGVPLAGVSDYRLGKLESGWIPCTDSGWEPTSITLTSVP